MPGHVSASQAVKVNRQLTSLMAAINHLFILDNVFKAYLSRLGLFAVPCTQIGQYERCLEMGNGQWSVWSAVSAKELEIEISFSSQSPGPDSSYRKYAHVNVTSHLCCRRGVSTRRVETLECLEVNSFTCVLSPVTMDMLLSAEEEVSVGKNMLDFFNGGIITWTPADGCILKLY